MDKVSSLMLSIIREELSDATSDFSAFSEIPEDVLEKIYSLSKYHDMAHLIGDFIIEKGLLANPDLLSKYQKAVMLAMYRYSKNHEELKAILDVLSEEKIPHIPLKGAVISSLYRKPWLRTSADIDVFVREEDLSCAKSALENKLHYTFSLLGPHDVAGDSPNGTHLELHYRLVEKGRVATSEKPLKSVWNDAVLVSDSFTYSLSPAMFLYYHYAHMAKHFVYGGCGIKPFIDLWLLQKQPLTKEDKNYLHNYLSDGGLSVFASVCDKLVSVFFDGVTPDKQCEKVTSYIFGGGTYGTVEKRVCIQSTKKGGKFKYFLSRIWLPKNDLQYLYPALKRHAFFLPFFEVVRWFDILFCGRIKNAFCELHANASLSKKELSDTKNMLKELHLL